MMSKRGIAVTVMIAVVLVGMVIIGSNSNVPVNYGDYRISAIKELAGKFENTNPDMVFEASEDTGNLPDKVIGAPDKADVIVYEYADYACSHCAEWSAAFEKMVDDSDGRLAVVYRGFLLGFRNSVISASAATAAQAQGCWQEYKDLLFTNQYDWTSLNGDALKDKFVAYFKSASGGKGDVEKFMADMKSEEIAKKIAFEYRLGNEIQLEGTPTFRVDGENIEIKNLKKVIEEKLANK